MGFTTKTITDIDAATLKYAPAVVQTVTAVEAAAAGLPGQSKAEIALGCVMAGAQQVENVPVPQVQGIAALINIVCAVLNACGVFKKKTPVAVPAQ